MTYESESRGLVYTAPPSGEGDDVDVRPEKPSLDAAGESDDEPATADDPGEAESGDENRTPEGSSPDLDPTTATTDANWTGTVSADSTVPADD